MIHSFLKGVKTRPLHLKGSKIKEYKRKDFFVHCTADLGASVPELCADAHEPERVLKGVLSKATSRSIVQT